MKRDQLCNGLFHFVYIFENENMESLIGNNYNKDIHKNLNIVSEK